MKIHSLVPIVVRFTAIERQRNKQYFRIRVISPIPPKTITHPHLNPHTHPRHPVGKVSETSTLCRKVHHTSTNAHTGNNTTTIYNIYRQEFKFHMHHTHVLYYTRFCASKQRFPPRFFRQRQPATTVSGDISYFYIWRVVAVTFIRCVRTLANSSQLIPRECDSSMMDTSMKSDRTKNRCIESQATKQVIFKYKFNVNNDSRIFSHTLTTHVVPILNLL